MLVEKIIQKILNEIPHSNRRETVDTLKKGHLDQEVSHVVSTFTATHEVIKEAVRIGADFIITHQPIFYNHMDQEDLLKTDRVYEAKNKLIAEHKLPIWRFHDYWHMHKPDGILKGFLKKIDWEKYHLQEDSVLVRIPEMTLDEICDLLKENLNIKTLRVVGEVDQYYRRVGLLLGSANGYNSLDLFKTQQAEVLICGEVKEWEACEYIRDSCSMGMPKAMIVIGHATSVEPGMEYFAEWLKELLPVLKVSYIASNDPFVTM